MSEPRPEEGLPVLHPCQVQTMDGDSLTTCGVAGEWWEAPSGRSFYVCARHRDHFGSSGGSDV